MLWPWKGQHTYSQVTEKNPQESVIRRYIFEDALIRRQVDQNRQGMLRNFLGNISAMAFTT
jgi:hypothetical protein